ncbi:hypothetical protein COO91_11126 (plasmid) [Nostoc flagelliforme CCNUN1]|uniref:Uncharacterized protein n=1 Tax=Nostoc flagelliforme CCNUN1 TaxID=2038116 RepID=A0A2K8TBB0_9NOSO|nr:hypothetical protein COO91_11126 [Nostoc flagelliforme CCNUN1]
MKLGRNARLRIRFIVDTFLKNQTTVQKTKEKFNLLQSQMRLFLV